MNGILAGLVGITAGADQMAMGSAMIIGLMAGILVVFSVVLIDRIRIDDPVGAISVHLVCGIWGTLAVGLLGAKAGAGQFLHQLVGVAAYGAFTVICSRALFLEIRAVMGLRVSEAEELEGLDPGEHGMHAYDLPIAGGGLFDDADAAIPVPAPALRTRAATVLSENA